MSPATRDTSAATSPIALLTRPPPPTDRRTARDDRAHTEKVLPRVYSGDADGGSGSGGGSGSESSEAIGEDPENMMVRPARPVTPGVALQRERQEEEEEREREREREEREREERERESSMQRSRRSLSPTTEARLAQLYNNYKSRYAESEEKRRSIAKRAEDSMRGRDAIQERRETAKEYWPGWAEDPLSPFEDCYCVYCKCDRRDLCFKHKQRRSLVGGGLLNADYYLAKFASPDGLGFALGTDDERRAPYHPSIHRRDEPRGERARVDRDLWRLMEEDAPVDTCRRALSETGDEDEDWLAAMEAPTPRPILRRKSAPVRPMAKWQLHARRRRDRRASLSKAQRPMDHRLSLPAKSPIPWGLDDDEDIPVTIAVQEQMMRFHLGQEYQQQQSPVASPTIAASSPRFHALSVASPRGPSALASPVLPPQPAVYIPTSLDSPRVHATLASPRISGNFPSSPSQAHFSPSYVPQSPQHFQRASLQTFQLPPAQQVHVQTPSPGHEMHSPALHAQQTFRETGEWGQPRAMTPEFEWGMGYDEVE